MFYEAVIGSRAILHGTFKLLDLGLSGLVGELAHNGVQEVDTTKGSSDDWINRVLGTLKSHLSLSASMRKDV